MTLAKERDVDMVLLSGDLFHDNKPSRKAMYQVIKSLRNNCYGEKPCELEILSDTSQTFQSAGGHVNYEDPDINVAIPVFSIHGNHDDPSGVGTLCLGFRPEVAKTDAMPGGPLMCAGFIVSRRATELLWPGSRERQYYSYTCAAPEGIH